MAILFDLPPFVFVVDTDQYAGNFERELCAFVTGHIGECGVGAEEAEEFRKDHLENPFEKAILHYPDEHGCSRPVSIWSTPGRFNDGMGGHFDLDQQEEANAHYHQACLDQGEHVKKVYAHAPEYGEQEAQKWVKQSNEPADRYPAYESVGILFQVLPDSTLIEIMKTRAKLFADNHNLQIRGFRLLKVNVVETELELP